MKIYNKKTIYVYVFKYILVLRMDVSDAKIRKLISLPNTIFKSILRIFACCSMIFQLLGKWATEKSVDMSTER